MPTERLPAPDTQLWRRTIIILVAAALVGAPAAALHAVCAGHSCDRPTAASTTVPFCSLPAPTKRALAAGFRDGRSPDVLAVTGATPVVGSSDPGLHRLAPAWPGETAGPSDVPLVFSGTGIVRGAPVPRGVTVDRIAPTVTEVIGLHRPHPEVRSGTAIEGVASGEVPRLVVAIVLKGTGSAALNFSAGGMPALRRLGRRGAATSSARPGSLPLDPAAVLTTIGTGGLPAQHGITGTLVRNDEGALTRAWGPGSPESVIATLGDDLDHGLPRARIGLVATDPADRGLTGGTWYLEASDDDLTITRRHAPAAVRSLLARGYGADSTTDLLAVTLEGEAGSMDRSIDAIAAAAREASDGSVAMVVTATGAAPEVDPSIPYRRIVRDVERDVRAPAGIVQAAAIGGLYLDQKLLGEAQISPAGIVDAIKRIEGPEGRLFADAFPAISVTFARYC